VVVALAHTFIDGIVQTASEAFPAHVHADLEEHIHDAGVLADRAVAGGAHFAVGQDLRNRILGGGALLALIGSGQMRDVVGRVVVADVLQRSGNGFDKVGLADGSGHGNRGNEEAEFSVCGWPKHCPTSACRCRQWPWPRQQESNVDRGLCDQHLRSV
jgi:hypothetical protein